jgi:hypothetical protein
MRNYPLVLVSNRGDRFLLRQWTDITIVKISSMRKIRRFLLFASEIGIVVLGSVSSFALAAVVGYFDSRAISLALTALFSGLFVTVAMFLLIRRKHRPWEIEYDAVGRALSRTERTLHPRHARYKRTLHRTLLWVPSAIAASVLFFLPVVTHMMHPRSQYLRHFRIPIPWTFTVFSPLGPPAEYSWVNAVVSSGGKGRFGVTPFWDRAQAFSLMNFGSIQPNADTFEFNHEMRQARRGGVTQVLSREFRLGQIPLLCWQYVSPSRKGVPLSNLLYAKGPYWEITCETPIDVHQQNFYASFDGREEDIPAFYKVIEGVTPVGASATGRMVATTTLVIGASGTIRC